MAPAQERMPAKGSVQILQHDSAGQGEGRSAEGFQSLREGSVACTVCVHSGDIGATLHVGMCHSAPFASGDAEDELGGNLPEPAWLSPNCRIWFWGPCSQDRG